MSKHILLALLIFMLVFCTACTGGTTESSKNTAQATATIDPTTVASVIQSLTMAAASPTPQIVDPQKIIDALNSTMVGADPLAETIEAKFQVVDIEYIRDQQSSEFRTMRIHIECEWVVSDSCTPEESFVNLIHAFISNKKTFENIKTLVPSALKDVQVATFNHMQQNGIIMVSWKDIVDYGDGNISGIQLGSRITKLAP